MEAFWVKTSPTDKAILGVGWIAKDNDDGDGDDEDKMQIWPKFWDLSTQTPNRLPQTEKWALSTKYDDDDDDDDTEDYENANEEEDDNWAFPRIDLGDPPPPQKKKNTCTLFKGWL